MATGDRWDWGKGTVYSSSHVYPTTWNPPNPPNPSDMTALVTQLNTQTELLSQIVQLLTKLVGEKDYWQAKAEILETLLEEKS